MAHWFHRNPLKATSDVKFDFKMVATDSNALKLCSDLRESRKKLLALIPNANHNIDTFETALTLYLSSLKALSLPPEDVGGEWSKVRHSIQYRWTSSMLGNTAEGHFDAIFELVSILQNAAFWYMKHASKVAAQDDVNMEEAKEVHRSLRRGAGILKYCQEEWVNKLIETPRSCGDSDPRVYSAYLNQATAEAQEVTIARAVEMKHNASLISALSNETSKMFTTAANSISFDTKNFGQWCKYLQLKAAFYMSYAYNYLGENLLNQDKCGDAIRSLQEAKKYYTEAIVICKEYVNTKSKFNSKTNPSHHQFFKRLLPIINRTLEKCERENGMIYHQKVPYDPPQLELKATYGLAAPDDYVLPPVSPLWTETTNAAFDLTKNIDTPKSLKADGSRKPDGDLPSVKETSYHNKQGDHKNESGCHIM